MAQSSTGHGIEDIYRGVIGDVINQVREAFLDENVDIDVLQQLKNSWESKVKASGAVDLEGPKLLPPPTIRQPQNRQTNSNRPAPANSSMLQSSSASNLLAQAQKSQENMNILRQNALQQQVLSQGNGNIQYLQNAGILDASQLLTSTSGIQLPPGFRVVNAPPNSSLAQYASLMQGMPGGSHQQNLNNIVVLPTTGQPQMQMNLAALSQTVANNQAMRPQQPHLIAMKMEPNLQNLNQLDGAGAFLDLDYNPTKPSSSQANLPREKEKPKAKKIPQLDGGPGMTDSSSEDELDEEEDDPLNRYAGLEDDKLDGDVVEEDPLNSDDDQSDDEDLETLFDAENVVVCQFEKVHRARSKWKFTLKDGVMHIDGKDYCFSKCSGEAEW